ncbi:uncharacterized protein DFL_008212 [Arthrobotrys flagrans]|uniref:Zn(2)-C6 fungal-type domain-containing protein n=1 Tax=Arthrobotrys flagrans TaxID=97331 RepID=A0A436ZN57_ARTFL|nr:hypothetical protein DFL_008212 [Arthrobotrys flagrans]
MDHMNSSSGQRWQKSEMRLDLGGATEQIKHRRTRSGCFTCRARRVKCDETRPICERCSKGGRKCTFPDTSTPKSTRTKRKQSNTSSSAQVPEKSPSPEDPESDAYFSDIHSVDFRFLSAYPLNSPNLAQSAPGSTRSQRSLSPVGVAYSGESHSEPRYPLYSHDSRSDSMISSLPIERTLSELAQTEPSPNKFDINFWLQYHRQNINFRHYLLKSDSSNFFSDVLLSYALQNNALLYSVVAFSALHYFIHEARTTGTDQTSSAEIFFGLHDRAIVSLRESFQENLPPDVFTLLTVLQLATLEEYLGDWANLIEHRKGAYMILESLFSPQSILDTSEGYPIFSWFTRIDLGVSMIAGLSTILDTEWYDAAYNSCRIQLAQHPDNLYWLALSAESSCRRITMQVVNVLHARFNGLCDYGSYEQAMVLASKDIESFWDQFSDLGATAQPISPTIQAQMNYVFAEIHAVGMLIHHQRSVLYGFDEEYMAGRCAAICDLVAATTAPYESDSPQTSLLPFQLALGMAAAFNTVDNLRMFLRARFHDIEQLGFLYPIPFRTFLSKLWEDETVRAEWVPGLQMSDNRDKFRPLTNILSAIKALAEDRNEEISFTNNIQSAQLMRNLFSFADLQA